LALLALFFIAAFLARPRNLERPSAATSPVGKAESTKENLLGTFSAEAGPGAPLDEAKLEAETEDGCLASLRWLLNRQNPDGSWGDGMASMDGVLISKPGITGLALLSMLGAGYSHLSKDTYDGLCMGDAVRNGLRWLMADQREDGLFRSSRGGLDHAVGAQALSEAYGLTGSNLFKAKAQASIAALVALRIQDGSWGDGTTTFWAADALFSAEISGLEFPRTAYDGLNAHYDRRAAPDAREMINRIQIQKDKEHPAVRSMAEVLSDSPPDEGRPLHDIYVQSRGVFHFDGPDGPSWKKWNEPFKKSVLSRQRPEGTWPGAGPNETIVQTSLGALTMAIYYRYANVYDSK